MGAELTKDTDIATALRDYYQNLSANVVDYARAKQFIILNFGTVDTSADNFGDVIYETMLEDSGMQLLLYMNGMWTTSGWTVNNEYAPALHGAADLLAEWLANTVNNEKIKSDTNDRLVAMGRQKPWPKLWLPWVTAMPPARLWPLPRTPQTAPARRLRQRNRHF